MVAARKRVKVNGKLLEVLQDVNTALLVQERPNAEQILVVLQHQMLVGFPLESGVGEAPLEQSMEAMDKVMM